MFLLGEFPTADIPAAVCEFAFFSFGTVSQVVLVADFFVSSSLDCEFLAGAWPHLQRWLKGSKTGSNVPPKGTRSRAPHQKIFFVCIPPEILQYWIGSHI